MCVCVRVRVCAQACVVHVETRDQCQLSPQFLLTFEMRVSHRIQSLARQQASAMSLYPSMQSLLVGIFLNAIDYGEHRCLIFDLGELSKGSHLI